jgi:LmbE family N-acetylglucosaminyl deacetylase
MSKHILIVAAHPDDEILGCGGTIARHVADGDTVTVLFITYGVGSRREDGTKEDHRIASVGIASEIERREAAANAAAKILGHEWYYVRRAEYSQPFSDQRLDDYGMLELTQAIEGAVAALPPIHIVYTHHMGDLNLDHQITARAVLTAFRPVPGSTVEAIYGFEVPSATEWGLHPFVPDYFNDITGFMGHKRDALMAYGEEMRDHPHPRSIQNVLNLAQARGAVVSVPAAEAFVTFRRVNRA